MRSRIASPAQRNELEDCLALGLAIGITGWICDERRGRHLLPLMPMIPADRLMIETDAPYLLPRSLKPSPPARRNEPAFLVEVATTVAAARGGKPADRGDHEHGCRHEILQPDLSLADETPRPSVTFVEDLSQETPLQTQ